MDWLFWLNMQQYIFFSSFCYWSSQTKNAWLVLKKIKFLFLHLFYLFCWLLMPNLYWNFNNGWVTLSHTADNTNLQNLNLNIYDPIKFLLSQIIMLGVVLFLSFFFSIRSFHLDFENKFLLVFSLPIILIVLIESFLVRANANWAAPALVSFYL